VGSTDEGPPVILGGKDQAPAGPAAQPETDEETEPPQPSLPMPRSAPPGE
jgi:hypothetical protein